MATWKKVIVSGSVAELQSVSASAALQAGNNQIINTQSSITKLSGSFSGSFQGDGSLLTNVNASSINVDTITDISNASDQLFISQSGGIKRITYGNFLSDLAGGNLVTESNDSLALAANVTGLTSISASFISASVVSASVFSGSFRGDGSLLTNLPAQSTSNALTDGAGIQTLSFNGSAAAKVTIKTGSVFTDNVMLKWDTDALQFQSSSLADDGNAVTGGSSIQLTGTSSKLTGSFTGSFTGDGTGLTGVGIKVTDSSSGNIVFATGDKSTLSGSAKLSYDQNTDVLTVTKTIKFSASVADSTATFSAFAHISTASIFTDANVANAIRIGNTTSTTLIGNDLIINGDLIANGSSSFINTQNLLVSDRFITLASSSNVNTDGGIIIQNSTSPAATGSGFAFYLETGTAAPRWAVTSSLNLNATGGSVDEYMVTAKVASGNPSGNPTWGGTDGAGNIYVNTADQSIWIYS